ncbi:hypothetical protein Pmar_PMAR029347 [Perkinsus marinus ATCC 50983]|uniref:Potassium channel tetramerisation-type BTB domain-containing protein n=1 Tax=Perkinsus marinus (strain ATCC 50983 / TXsc) TaxID=423536 RepID=C5KMW7_PERM5|nr:hypothetical protein Pmar_PMAR029347 [Perkinsus marinus ATCC 50983]EER14275.1 hypothetical protein Pmar_PMAR029347 [Perkinsus marinus ATCC 50983]|eukprot:XP_002782480.1 hypothetical protein Pmar_PMAR029347 [Perkinsus marinus ATCC 50983]
MSSNSPTGLGEQLQRGGRVKEESPDGTGVLGDDSRGGPAVEKRNRRVTTNNTTNNPKKRKISDRSTASSSSTGEYIEIDVRGRRHSILISELESKPATLLSKRVEELEEGSTSAVELNEAQPELFPYVLGWYTRGQITIPIEVTEDSIRHECRKLGLPSDVSVKFDTASMQSISKALVANSTAIVQAPEKTAKLLVAQEIFKFVYTNMWKNLKSEQVANMTKEGWSKTMPKLRLLIEDFSEKDWKDVIKLIVKEAKDRGYGAELLCDEQQQPAKIKLTMFQG